MPYNSSKGGGGGGGGVDLYHYKWERKEGGGGGSRWECSPRTLVPWPNTPHGGRRSLHFCEFFLLPRERKMRSKIKHWQ
jgi:hypothetical protein